jgi:transcription elongation GreA/GreB family factor
LRTRGYEVTPQLGVAGYRIDIAVKHPDALGSYLAAIECDGASYHSALSVRDRDRIRQEVLEALGWRGRIWRIWSTDWFRTPRQETDKLISFLDGLRTSWKPEHSTGESWIEEGQGAKSSGSSSTPSTAAEVIDPQGAIQAQIEREAVSSALIDSEEDLEIEVGDVVRYIDLTKPQEIQTVQITSGKDDFANGIVNETRPLAQALLGAVVGDQISLNFPGTASRVLQITDIKRT